MTEDNKMKIWIHYMVKQCYLNSWLKIENKNNLPELGIRSYDDFCADLDDRKAASLSGYYWRFKNEIKL